MVPAIHQPPGKPINADVPHTIVKWYLIHSLASLSISFLVNTLSGVSSKATIISIGVQNLESSLVRNSSRSTFTKGRLRLAESTLFQRVMLLSLLFSIMTIVLCGCHGVTALHSKL